MGREAQVMAPPVAHEPARPAHDPHQWKRASRALLRFQYHFAHLPHAKLRDPGHHNLPHGAPTGPTGHLRDLRSTYGTYGAPREAAGAPEIADGGAPELEEEEVDAWEETVERDVEEETRDGADEEESEAPGSPSSWAWEAPVKKMFTKMRIVIRFAIDDD